MKKLFAFLLLAGVFIFSFANQGETVSQKNGLAEITFEQGGYKKMTTSEITTLLGDNWHKNGAKTKYLKRYKSKMKGDTNADFYKDKKTKRVYLITNRKKYTIETNDYL